MAKDFLPRADSELLQWLRNFSARLNEAPESFGVPVDLAEALAELYQEFDEAYRASVDPATRGRLSVARKNFCREHVKREARILARCVQNRMETTDAQRVILGLTVASGGAPIQRPSHAPTMEIVSADGWSVVVQLRPAGSISRGLPKGTVL